MKLKGLLVFCCSIQQLLYAQLVTDLPFNSSWKFKLGNDPAAISPNFNDASWRTLTLPHDWSIEGKFSENLTSTINKAGLPAGIGWYRKHFVLPASSAGKQVYINFDGVYKNSEAWINGHYLGKRPNGYISFRYNLTPHLYAGNKENLLVVKVNSADQPGSRWYTGAGIYRKVWLHIVNDIAVDHQGTFVTTPVVTNETALVNIQTQVINKTGKAQKISLQHEIMNAAGKIVGDQLSVGIQLSDSGKTLSDKIMVRDPVLWSIEQPYLYTLKTTVMSGGRVLDEYETPFGIRHFTFDAAKGFFLNGKSVKILGVSHHPDLGALGAAVNTHAIERQLRILKAMGCNAIRTAHHPPATELLDLCDKMGFIVMDEAFDRWKEPKNKQDDRLNFEDWQTTDLRDQVKRDRNHPSVFMWSIGNENGEQLDSTCTTITKDLVGIIKELDTTRPVTAVLTENIPEKNFIYQYGALDLLGFNYKPETYPDLPLRFPNKPLIAAETTSVLATRGWYEMPKDSIDLWPATGTTPFKKENAAHKVSAYDHVRTSWGSTHEAGWNAVKKLPFMAGLFVWSGFDFLGEPVPYNWPLKSSSCGIIDRAGFPKDVYYMYQSEWANKPVLHLFPHWNWQPGKLVDVWAYYNNADEVELFVNGKSGGVQKKSGDVLHVKWRVPFQPGNIKAVSRKNGITVLEKQIFTAGKAAKIELVADQRIINSRSDDLSFVTARVLDGQGNLVPDADHLIRFQVTGNGFLAGVDNGSQTSTESFKASQRKAFHGMCLAIVQTNNKPGKITLTATVKGWPAATIEIVAK